MRCKFLIYILFTTFIPSLATGSDDLAHESTHKAISETKYAKHLINQDQEKTVAKIVCKQAGHVAKAFKDRDSSTKLNPAATDHIAWNAKNKEALKANNERLKAVKEGEVKASSWLLGNGSPNPLKEHQDRKKAQADRLARKAAGEPIYEYNIPVVGPLLQFEDSLIEGKPWQAARYAVQGLLEGLPPVMVTGLVTKGLNLTGKGARVVLKPVIQKILGQVNKNEKSLGYSKKAVQHWLQNVGNLERSQLIRDLESAGFKRISPVNSPSIHYGRGGMKIRLDLPQKGTPFNHMHLEYGGNSYNHFLDSVYYRSPAAHIPIK